MQETELKRQLGFWDASAIVIGTMIGSGIFLVPSYVAMSTSSSAIFLGIWVVFGIFTLLGAICYGELSAMFPKAGGQYVFLREALGPLPSFLYGWTFFTVIQSGITAALSIAFAKYLGQFFPQIGEKNVLFTIGNFSINKAQPVAAIFILLLTWINSKGAAAGSFVQNLFTLVKGLAIAALIVLGFSLGKGDWSHFLPVWDSSVPSWTPSPDDATAKLTFLGLLGAMTTKVLFSYDGWNTATFVAAEIREPHKNLPKALSFGTVVVMVIYIAMSAVCLYLYPLSQIATVTENRIASSIANLLFGPVGASLITVAILISIFGSSNGMLFTGGRVLYALANDGLFFQSAKKLNNHLAPARATWILGLWSMLLVFSGKYNDLLDATMFAMLIFNGMTVICVLVLRIKKPSLERPYRTWGYPFTPILFFVGAFFCAGYIFYAMPKMSILGVGIILLGVPVYFWLTRKKS